MCPGRHLGPSDHTYPLLSLGIGVWKGVLDQSGLSGFHPRISGHPPLYPGTCRETPVSGRPDLPLSLSPRSPLPKIPSGPTLGVQSLTVPSWTVYKEDGRGW